MKQALGKKGLLEKWLKGKVWKLNLKKTPGEEV
jgi:hypothetical protein